MELYKNKNKRKGETQNRKPKPFVERVCGERCS